MDVNQKENEDTGKQINFSIVAFTYSHIKDTSICRKKKNNNKNKSETWGVGRNYG